ncbi:hypothetical protein HCB18_27495, partial [Salinispora arenicola]|nr:hypothetical protein [Salinispora arenicola]
RIWICVVVTGVTVAKEFACEPGHTGLGKQREQVPMVAKVRGEGPLRELGEPALI